MAAPVLITKFGVDVPFSLAELNKNFERLVASLNAISVTPLVQFSAVPGVPAGAMPTTGGAFSGAISTPSALIGPPGGPFAVVVDQNLIATQVARGAVKQAAPVANTAPAQGGAYVQADVQAILTELRAVKTALVNAGLMA
jgi:hypothetical protein